MEKFIIKNCDCRSFCSCKSVSYEDCIIKKIVKICERSLNLCDYKTYFKRNNYSIKQEAIKGFKDILDLLDVEVINEL